MGGNNYFPTSFPTNELRPAKVHVTYSGAGRYHNYRAENTGSQRLASNQNLNDSVDEFSDFTLKAVVFPS